MRFITANSASIFKSPASAEFSRRRRSFLNLNLTNTFTRKTDFTAHLPVRRSFISQQTETARQHLRRLVPVRTTSFDDACFISSSCGVFRTVLFSSAVMSSNAFGITAQRVFTEVMRLLRRSIRIGRHQPVYPVASSNFPHSVRGPVYASQLTCGAQVYVQL